VQGRLLYPLPKVFLFAPHPNPLPQRRIKGKNFLSIARS
jgi:hypothetical protein